MNMLAMQDSALDRHGDAERRDAGHAGQGAALELRAVRQPQIHLQAMWARHADEVLEAQRLRYRIFVEEMGARLSPPAGTPPGVDIDLFDAYCEHLVVRTVETDTEPSEVVGTYRVMTPDAARRVGGFYTETEFDLTRLHALRPKMIELGRSCTDARFRKGGVVMLLWSKLAEYMQCNKLQITFGCASMPMRDGGHAAASLWSLLRGKHLASIEHQVRARLPLPVDELRSDLAVEPPALIKGYLNCGAKVLGAPAWDPDFGTADFPMMLDLNELPASYRKRFIGG